LTGFYVGAYAGYGWGSQNWNLTFSNQGLALDGTTIAAPINWGLSGAFRPDTIFSRGFGSMAWKPTAPEPVPVAVPAMRFLLTMTRAQK
jgi:hypothetical protein